MLHYIANCIIIINNNISASLLLVTTGGKKVGAFNCYSTGVKMVLVCGPGECPKCWREQVN